MSPLQFSTCITRCVTLNEYSKFWFGPWKSKALLTLVASERQVMTSGAACRKQAVDAGMALSLIPRAAR